jgi:D-3-phosphoglycerate dehydrogenase
MTSGAVRRTVISSSPTFGRYSDEPVELLRAADCTVQLLEPGDRDSLMRMLPDAHAWITGFEPVNESTLTDAGRIQVVAKCGVGMDNFDMDYLAGRGIAAVNVPGGNSGAVAEYTLAQVLALARGVVVNDGAVRNGAAWKPNIGLGLDGRTIGIVGFGAIGQKVAQLARVFGMSVIVADPLAEQATLDAHAVASMTLIELLHRADVVSIHVPLTDDTRHMIGAAELSAMPPHALLVNNSRGGVVDEDAVTAALQAGSLAGAALDVFEREPLSHDSRLCATPNLILSPHTAGYSDSALAAVTRRCAEAVAAKLLTTTQEVTSTVGSSTSAGQERR